MLPVSLFLLRRLRRLLQGSWSQKWAQTHNFWVCSSVVLKGHAEGRVGVEFMWKPGIRAKSESRIAKESFGSFGTWSCWLAQMWWGLRCRGSGLGDPGGGLGCEGASTKGGAWCCHPLSQIFRCETLAVWNTEIQLQGDVGGLDLNNRTWARCLLFVSKRDVCMFLEDNWYLYLEASINENCGFNQLCLITKTGEQFWT